METLRTFRENLLRSFNSLSKRGVSILFFYLLPGLTSKDGGRTQLSLPAPSRASSVYATESKLRKHSEHFEKITQEFQLAIEKRCFKKNKLFWPTTSVADSVLSTHNRHVQVCQCLHKSWSSWCSLAQEHFLTWVALLVRKYEFLPPECREFESRLCHLCFLLLARKTCAHAIEHGFSSAVRTLENDLFQWLCFNYSCTGQCIVFLPYHVGLFTINY